MLLPWGHKVTQPRRSSQRLHPIKISSRSAKLQIPMYMRVIGGMFLVHQHMSGRSRNLRVSAEAAGKEAESLVGGRKAAWEGRVPNPIPRGSNDAGCSNAEGTAVAVRTLACLPFGVADRLLTSHGYRHRHLPRAVSPDRYNCPIPGCVTHLRPRCGPDRASALIRPLIQ